MGVHASPFAVGDFSESVEALAPGADPAATLHESRKQGTWSQAADAAGTMLIQNQEWRRTARARRHGGKLSAAVLQHPRSVAIAVEAAEHAMINSAMRRRSILRRSSHPRHSSSF